MYKNCIKAFIITVMNFLICFFIAISSFADYSITQLTDNDYDDYSPQINNRGEVVWYADEGNGFEIFYYDGTNIIQVTDNNYGDIFPQINNSGEVTWYGFSGNDSEIILAIFIGDSDGGGESG